MSTGNSQFDVTPVASAIPFDNSTAGATGLTSTDTQNVIEEVYQKVSGSGGGVSPPFIFQRTGGSAGTYLNIGNVASNQSGYILRGSNKIVGLAVSGQANVASNTTIQLQQRTAVGTLVDIAGAAVTIPSGSYRAEITLAVSISSSEEISCYVKTGALNGGTNVTMYVVPS